MKSAKVALWAKQAQRVRMAFYFKHTLCSKRDLLQQIGLLFVFGKGASLF